MKIVLIVAGGLAGLAVVLVAGVAILSAIGSARMQALYAAERAVLEAQARTVHAEAPATSGLERLPVPVRTFVSKTRGSGPSSMRLAVLQQRGDIRTGPAQPWMPFESEQVYSFDPPGFLWLARARVAPGVSIWVRDKYMDGRGNMLVRPLGVFTLADAAGPELDQGAALRFWGEALCFPGIALNPRVTWRPLDSRKAAVRVEDGGLHVEGAIEFDEQGDVAAVHADRYQAVDGRFVLLPWTGRTRDWKTVGGVRIATHWEALWHMPAGDFPYFRLDIVGVRTE